MGVEPIVHDAEKYLGMASTTILKGKKFCVSIHDAGKRDDFVKVTVIAQDGVKAYHHITPDEAQVFAFALRRAAAKRRRK